MPQYCVLELIDLLKPHYDQAYSTIPFHLKVLTALNFFANGSCQNPVGRHSTLNISQSSVCRSIKTVANLVVRHMRSYLKFPTSENEINAIKNGFREKFGIDHTIGCIDCTHVTIVAPPIDDDAHPPRIYCNRKRYYSINDEAICDTKLRFLAVNARHPGSSHDSGIWMTSAIRRHMLEIRRPDNYWLLGDSGYPLQPWLMTPYMIPTESHHEKFNKLHIASRNCIERSFGVLKSIFRCLLKHRTLHYHPVKTAKIINSCKKYLKIETELDDDEDSDNEHDENNGPAQDNSSLFLRGSAIRDAYAQTLQI